MFSEWMLLNLSGLSRFLATRGTAQSALGGFWRYLNLYLHTGSWRYLEIYISFLLLNKTVTSNSEPLLNLNPFDSKNQCYFIHVYFSVY